MPFGKKKKMKKLMNNDPKCNIFSLKKKTIHTAKLFSIEEVKIDLKNGRKVIHEVVERKPSVCVLPLTQDYELYLVSQYRYLLGKTTIEAMAGFVEKDEKPLQAAKRELKEETGIDALSWELVTTVESSASVVRATCSIYLATKLELGDANPDEDEDIEIIKIPLHEAVQKVISGEINTVSSMIGILMLDKLRKEKKL